MSKEAKDALCKYFRQKDTKFLFFGNEAVAQELSIFFSLGNIMLNEVPNQGPDLIALYNGHCLAIEHFEFDCYKNTQKGSQNRREQARIENSFTPRISNAYSHDIIHGESSYSQYITNVTKMFLHHYERINSYKENLLAKQVVDSENKIKIVFLIEDVSPLGAVVESDDSEIPVFLARSKEFLALMRQNPDVDYVIACSEYGSSQFVWLIPYELLDDYENNSIDYSNMKFIDFTPQVTSFSFIIPRESEDAR